MLDCMFLHVRSHGRLWGLAILAVASLAVPNASADTLYRFVDAGGVLHFSNAPTDPRYKKIGRAQASVRRSALVPSLTMRETIQRISRRHSLSPALVHAVIQAESAYDPNAVSSKGAMGVMQLMPDTAAWMNVTNPYDPEDNISGGVRYLRYLLDRFEGNLELALAAYNAGESRVLRARQIPRINETQQYVRKVLRLYRNLAQEEVVTRRFVNYLSPH